MNIRYDDTVHALVEGGFDTLCGNAMVPVCMPEDTDDAVNCWECVSILD